MPRFRPSRRAFLHGGAAAAAACAAGAYCRAAPLSDALRSAVYPDDAFSRPAQDHLPIFETLDGCSPAGDVLTRAAHFDRNDVRLAGNGALTRTEWRFRPKDDRQAVLMLQVRLRRAPTAITLRVRSAGRPIALELVTQEMQWTPVREAVDVPWRYDVQKTAAADTETTVRFDCAITAWADRRSPAVPRYPMVALMLAAKELEPGVDYSLELSDLTVHYPPASDLRLRSPIHAGGALSLVAGRAASFRVDLSGRTAARTIDIEVRRDPWVVWRIRLTPHERAAAGVGAISVRRIVPAWLAPGPCTVGLVADGYRLAHADGLARITNAARPALPRCERRQVNGRPAMVVNGEPFPWSGYSSYEYAPGAVAQFGASGATVFCVPTCAGQHVHHVAAATWPSPGRFDFGELEERVGFSLQANPRALIMLRVSLSAPPFWVQSHPDELARVAGASGTVVWEETGSAGASLASERWRVDQARALRALIRHCRAQPWAGRLAGFWVTGEVTEEWFHWGCNDGMLSDYSPAAQRAFASARPDRAPIPPAAARRRPGRDLYPDDEEGRRAAAYHQYLSSLTAETIGLFARVVKEETSGRSLAGTFYGYVIELAGEPRQATSGHFGVREVIDDPNIDFVGGVPLLDFRDLTNGYNPYCSATESLLAAGKLVCSENDMFTWLHPLHWHTLYNPADPRAGAISMHRRECANDAVHGTMAQKFSLMASWHADHRLHLDFAKQAAVIAQSLKMDRSPAEEIAFVVDDRGMAWTPPESPVLHAAHKRLLHQLGRTGAPVGVWLLSDLDRLPARIRFVVVAQATAASPASLESLAAAIRRGGRTLLVVGAPGLVDRTTERWDAGAPGRILGLPIRIDEEPSPATSAAGPGSLAIPAIPPLHPRPWMDAPGLMSYADGKTAAAVRDLPDRGKLIWCGPAPCSTPLLRRWIEGAGIQPHAPEGCFVHAARGLVAVTAPTAGVAALHLGGHCHATDLFDGWTDSGESISCPFEAGQTRLFAIRR